MLHELDHPTFVEVIEKPSDVGIKNVVHLPLQERVRQRIQRLMLAAPRTKPIREAEKALLVKSGYIFSDGNVTVIKENKVVANVKDINMLLVLGFDVYRQDPDATIKVVKGEGYDRLKLREDSWERKPAYVLGAEKGDLKSKQFWVEKDTLLFMREIEPARDDASKLDEIRFIHYQPLVGAWIAAGVEVYSGKKVFSEDYSYPSERQVGASRFRSRKVQYNALGEVVDVRSSASISSSLCLHRRVR